jgi:hypothetical protein
MDKMDKINTKITSKNYKEKKINAEREMDMYSGF